LRINELSSEADFVGLDIKNQIDVKRASTNNGLHQRVMGGPFKPSRMAYRCKLFLAEQSNTYWVIIADEK